MLPRNHPDRIQIVFDDHRLVANAGLLLPVTLAQHLGLPRAVSLLGEYRMILQHGTSNRLSNWGVEPLASLPQHLAQKSWVAYPLSVLVGRSGQWYWE